MKSIYFCPKCHCKMIPPAFLKTANIQGNINLACANKNKGCNGVIKIKSKVKEEIKIDNAS